MPPLRSCAAVALLLLIGCGPPRQYTEEADHSHTWVRLPCYDRLCGDMGHGDFAIAWCPSCGEVTRNTKECGTLVELPNCQQVYNALFIPEYRVKYPRSPSGTMLVSDGISSTVPIYSVYLPPNPGWRQSFLWRRAYYSLVSRVGKCRAGWNLNEDTGEYELPRKERGK